MSEINIEFCFITRQPAEYMIGNSLVVWLVAVLFRL